MTAALFNCFPRRELIFTAPEKNLKYEVKDYDSKDLGLMLFEKPTDILFNSTT